MLFDNLFDLMSPLVTVGMLGFIVAFLTVVTVGYLAYERDPRCRLLMSQHRI